MKWSEIKPSFLFLLRFLAFYLIANFLYGWWVTSYEPKPDPITVSATHQSTFLLSLAGLDVSNITHHKKAAERILLGTRPVLSVHEGCNGLNVWIIFVGFIFAFSGFSKKGAVFVLGGSVIIHIVNLGRIIFLFFISLNYPDALYFFHKYFFTATLYLVVFVMWYYWITYYGKPTQKTT